jgi:hypothetical protein
MFEWIISGAERWAVLEGRTPQWDGLEVLVAQRGTTVVVMDQSDLGVSVVRQYATDEAALGEFHGAVAHFVSDHGSEVTRAWTDAEVAL